MPDNRDKFYSIALPCVLSPEEQAAIECAMENCYIDTCNDESLKAILHNTGHDTDLETIFEKLAKLTAVPIATGKSREPVVFMLDSLSALEYIQETPDDGLHQGLGYANGLRVVR